jgi:hypothetical protein
MHSAMYRTNALVTYAFTVLGAMALATTLTGAHPAPQANS